MDKISKKESKIVSSVHNNSGQGKGNELNQENKKTTSSSGVSLTSGKQKSRVGRVFQHKLKGSGRLEIQYP
jgi:hypothetical protein